MTRRRRRLWILRRFAIAFLQGLVVGALVATFVLFVLWASSQEGLLT